MTVEILIALFQEFFYLFYGEMLFIVVAVLLVVSVFLAVATVVKAIDET